ncbi:MAG: hypothetical protein WBR24_19965 [Desulfobacterales bacterium]
MGLQTLYDTLPWEWPQGADELILRVLRDNGADKSDRLLAAELAGDSTVVNDDLVDALLSILGNGDASDGLRGRAAISLGPALEYADIEWFEDLGGFADPAAVPISEPTFRKIQEALRKLFADAGVPKSVRRRILEAAVRAPQDWHHNAIRVAYLSDDKDWKLTAVFCMRYIRGFDDWILESLGSKNADIHYQVVCAAGNWEVDAAWPHIAGLVTSAHTEKSLLLAAIEALASIRAQAAQEILGRLTDSDDEDIVEAVYEAMSMAGGFWGEGDDEYMR